MTIAKQLALVLVKEIIADKKNRHIAPDYALRNEVNVLVGQALDALVDDGSLVLRSASVNRYPAYEIPKTSRQGTCNISYYRPSRSHVAKSNASNERKELDDKIFGHNDNEDEIMIIDYISARIFKNHFEFDIPVRNFYDESGNHDYEEEPINHNSIANRYSAPTVRCAVQWLKDKLGLSISVETGEYCYSIKAVGPKGSIEHKLGFEYGIGKAYMCGMQYGIEETL